MLAKQDRTTTQTQNSQKIELVVRPHVAHKDVVNILINEGH